VKKESDNVIDVRAVTKIFGDIIAVNQATFTVDQGEIFGFLGPNGAGKTTTIRMLTGLLTPDSGDVFIDGIDIKKNPVKAKMKMGVILEAGNVYTDLTAKQNIVLAGRFYRIPRRELEKRADSLLRQFQLDDRKDDVVRNFSKGMRQRVNIASVLVHHPEILFLDEPTSGLDVQSQRLIKKIINQMNQEETTIFLTTHNIEEANQLCKRIAIINKGKIVVIDKPESLRNTFETTQSVEISFDNSMDESLIGKSNVVNRIERLGDKWKLFTDNPDELVKYLTRFAEEKNLIIVSMEICRASLEDVFIKFTESTHEHTNHYQ